MESQKILAIWIDQSIAYLMHLNNDTIVTSIVKANKVHQIENQNANQDGRCYSGTNHKSLSLFFRQINDSIINFEYVTLFGPSGSMNELFNYLLHNHMFDRINISIKYADEMDIIDMEKSVRSNTMKTNQRYSAFQKRANPFFHMEPSLSLTSIV